MAGTALGAGAAAAGVFGMRAAEADETSGDGGSFSWEKEPEPVDESLVSETQECEVCVVGAGNAGVVAALTAVEAGADVVVMQNKAQVNTQGTGGCCLFSKLQKENGIDCNEFLEEAVQQWEKDSARQYKPELLKQWMDHSGETKDWIAEELEGSGVSQYLNLDDGWREAKDFEYAALPVSNGYCDDEGNDLGVIAAIRVLAQKAEDAGARFVYSVTGERLEKDGSGRVVAVLGKKEDGTYLRVRASKGVILCSGGYEGNLEMRAKYLPQSRDYAVVTDNMGEGLLMGMWAGGKIENAPHCTNMHLELDLKPDLNFAWGSAMPWLRVNCLGKRVGNEDVPYQYVALQCTKQPDGKGYQILDSEFDKYYPTVLDGDIGLFRGNPDAAYGRICFEPALQNAGVDTSDMTDLQVIYEGGAVKGCVYKADTLEELAEKAGIDPDGLVATVERYNELYDSGVDSDCYKPFNCMSAVRVPPFYCVPITPIPLASLSGLEINDKMQVLTAEGDPIPGLYAAGNTTGGLFGGLTQVMVFGGLTIGRAHTFGRLAAQNCVSDN